METSPSLRELFDEAVMLVPEQRAGFLAARCLDPALRTTIERLLAADAAADSAWFSDGAEGAARAIGEADVAQSLPPGSRIGPFELVSVLGEGGSSTVFRAYREVEGVRQDVALKLLRRGLYSPDAQKQFRRERQALSQLRHGGIARLIEGGVTESGLAYIALELVEGKPLTDYSRERRLDLRERLRLFQQICRAVESAHRALIVHRDLKPSNVLVSEDGQVKLLDFGIAKLLDDEAEMQTHLPAFTPAYAAPEQRSGAPVTTATDVYALGILLGELITGQRLTGNTGQTPSSQVAEGGDPGVLPASAQITRRSLRGDLDNIVLKAIDAEPERRYASAGALADDIDRLIDGRPVTAHPPSAWYRTRKFVARHRGSVVATMGFLLALIAAFGIAVWQAAVARHETQTATREAARANATKDFVIRIFRFSDPRIAQDKPRGQITAKELLDLNAAKVSEQFAGDPETQIELLGVVASAYRELGDNERYDALHQQQTDLARRTEGELSPVLIEGLIDQAQMANRRRDFAATNALLMQADPLIHRADLDKSWLRAYWWLSRAVSLRGDYAAREARAAALENAVSLYARYGPTHSGYAEAVYTLGSDAVDEPAKVEQYDRKAIAIMESLPDRDDSGLQVMYGSLGLAQQNLGNFDGAERTYAHVAELARHTTGERHPRYWAEEAKHARMVHRQGDRVRAQQMYATLFELLPAQPNAEEIDSVTSVREQYAECLIAEGRVQLAIPLLLAVKQRREQVRGAEHNLRNVRATLGDAYDRTGDADAARRELDASLQEWIAKATADSFPVLQIRERWARFLLDHNDMHEAETQFRQVLANAHDRNLAPIALAHAGVARLALDRHDVATAVAESRLAIATFDHVTGIRDVRVGPYVWLILADALHASGDIRAAEPWARRALEASRRYDDPSAASIRNAEAALHAASANRP
jgi:tRNA A-37 threonylcarbamoyl transferase component Bud32